MIKNKAFLLLLRLSGTTSLITVSKASLVAVPLPRSLRFSVNDVIELLYSLIMEKNSIAETVF